jgi:hypothetical protein
MKWYFALSQATAQTYDLHVRAAVLSARKNTSLSPNFLYDGKPDVLCAWLRQQGVNVVYASVPYWKKMDGAKARGYCPDIARGAFLRTEIPSIDPTDDIILYTDCDVIFLKEPVYEGPPIRCFAVAPETDIHDYSVHGINTGVMLMNLATLRKAQQSFREYIIGNFESFNAYDQGAYRIYYNGLWERLPPEMNWKPYWGFSEDARIIHFHGPKYDHVLSLLSGDRSWWRYEALFHANEAAYRRYVELVREFFE